MLFFHGLQNFFQDLSFPLSQTALSSGTPLQDSHLSLSWSALHSTEHLVLLNLVTKGVCRLLLCLVHGCLLSCDNFIVFLSPLFLYQLSLNQSLVLGFQNDSNRAGSGIFFFLNHIYLVLTIMTHTAEMSVWKP